jgi:hypothetical protein
VDLPRDDDSQSAWLRGGRPYGVWAPKRRPGVPISTVGMKRSGRCGNDGGQSAGRLAPRPSEAVPLWGRLSTCGRLPIGQQWRRRAGAQEAIPPHQ